MQTNKGSRQILIRKTPEKTAEDEDINMIRANNLVLSITGDMGKVQWTMGVNGNTVRTRDVRRRTNSGHVPSPNPEHFISLTFLFIVYHRLLFYNHF